jgi:glycosyltransferase involved in cell wall biosynthesis
LRLNVSLKTEFSVIVPAFNESETIESFIKRLKATLEDVEGNHEIIVIDDGSNDNTYSIVSGLPDIKIVKHPYNKGNGAAVKSGIAKARGEYIVIIDADGQHDPKYIPDMLRLLVEYDLVVGARESFGISRRGFGNSLVSRLASYLSGIKIPDLTCGFRAFKKEKMLEFIDILPNGFSLPSTSTLAFATTGYNIKFIPTSANIRQGGESSISISTDGVKFLILIVRMISLFKPLKVFVPVSILLVFMSLVWSFKTLSYTGEITPTSTMLFLAGIFTFLFGVLADKIAELRLSLGKISNMLRNKTTNELD